MSRSLRPLMTNLALAAGVSLVCWLVLEGTVRAFDLFAPLRDAVRKVEAPRMSPGKVGGTVVHPFLGWAGSPRDGNTEESFLLGGNYFPGAKPSRWAVANTRFNVFGYRSAIWDYRQLDKDRFVVGVLGGSLAAHLVILSGDRLRSELVRRFPHLRGRVEVLNLGGGGYKQPQQVATLSEMLMLGVQLDLVVNLDGLNEVAFGGSDTRLHGVHPFFPSYGHYNKYLALLTGHLSPAAIEQAAAVVRHRRSAERWAERASTTPVLRHSAVFTALAGALVRRHLSRAQEIEARLQTQEGDLAPDFPVARLDDPCLEDGGLEDGGDCWELIADLWREGSLLLDGMARRHGLIYVHFLQPNQYVPGAKPLGPEERRVAYREESIWSETVPRGYPLLRARGAELRAAGVVFHDLSGIFEDVEEPLYVDDCCHLNVAGHRLLASRIVRLLPEIEP